MTTIGRGVSDAARAAAEAARRAAAEAAKKAAEAAAKKAAEAAAKKAAEAAAKKASTFKPSAAAKAKRETELNALDTKLKDAGVPDETRNAIRARLEKLSPADYTRETAVIDKLSSSKNADRALIAYDKIAAQAEASPEAAKRLTPEIRESLARGVAESRTADDVGQEGVLGVAQAEQAARALTTMPKEQYDQVSQALSKAGTGAAASPKADPQAEKALILKAVASRADRLQPSAIDDNLKKSGLIKSTEAEKAMQEITDFSADVRGMPRDELIRTTTTIDVEKANTSNVDPLNLPADGKKGVDSRGDNDGLYQRFEDTCGPTTAQLTRAEADPVFARQLHKGGLDSSDPTSATAKEQRETLEKPRFFDVNDNEVFPSASQIEKFKTDGTKPPGVDSVEIGNTSARRADQAASRTAKAINELTGVPDFAKNACKKLVRGEDLGFIEKAIANYTLGKVREKNDGHPTGEEIRQIQNERVKGENNGMRLEPALHDIASPATNKKYTANDVGSSVSTGRLDDMDKQLKNGVDVPIRVSDAENSGGHFMLMSDVRGKSPDRTYLVSDPYSGRTAWVKEADLKNNDSKWLKDQFDLGWTKISHTYEK